MERKAAFPGTHFSFVPLSGKINAGGFRQSAANIQKFPCGYGAFTIFAAEHIRLDTDFDLKIRPHERKPFTFQTDKDVREYGQRLTSFNNASNDTEGA